MLYIAQKDDLKFYVNPEDAQRYAKEGYKIIDNEGICLTKEEIETLKPETTPIWRNEL